MIEEVLQEEEEEVVVDKEEILVQEMIEVDKEDHQHQEVEVAHLIQIKIHLTNQQEAQDLEEEINSKKLFLHTCFLSLGVFISM
jgi:hypothetical protein